MARRANSKQLLRAREAACECLPLTRSHQAVGLYGGCANGLRPRKGALGEDGCRKADDKGPPAGKEHRKPELYYNNVLEGSRLVAEQCAKDIIFS